jgi:hypothetical protein
MTLTEIPKLIAFHLPQFHRIPENDAWWGEGFTEWTNVKKAVPRFRGHYQPVAPLDNNYYDLTDPNVREWQANLARDHGIHGFCYYHYWFRGKRVLHAPCEQILTSGQPDFPFCFSWANESWTRSWDGGNQNVLIQQDYGIKDDWREHFDYLLPFFRDSRYIRYKDRPLFLIYRPQLFPDHPRMLAWWNHWAQDEGLPGISFIKTRTCFDWHPATAPFSAGVDFEPWLTSRRLMPLNQRLRVLTRRGFARASKYINFNRPFLHSYDQIWNSILKRRYGPDQFPGAFVGWDNTPRLGDRSLIVGGSSPEKFGIYMRQLIDRARLDESPFLFINSWNEWAEGANLEPDQRHGLAYLENLAAAIQACEQSA